MLAKFVRPIGFALFAAVMSAPLLAATPIDVVKGRIANFKELATAFKNLNDMLKADSPTPYFIQVQAREINTAARDQYSWFPAGTAGPKVAGMASKAKPEIWAQPVQFKAAQDAFAAQAKAMMDAAASRDIDKMQAQAKLLGQTCSTCHRTFRTE